MKVPFSYLPEQFADTDAIFAALRELASSGDFTLGAPVREFEESFAAMTGSRHAIGVNSGTDALKLSLLAAGVGPGDEVITAANTFIATAGAINEVGARTMFVDCDDSFCLDIDRMERAIGSRTKAIIPVHMTGNVADMPRIMEIAERNGLTVIEDACQAIRARRGGCGAGTWGRMGAFSLHPLKFLNIWGDGGVIVSDDDDTAERLRLLRNHGFVDRDTVAMFGCNTRLDSVQAVVASHILPDSDDTIRRRNRNAAFYDAAFADVGGVRVPPREPEVEHAFVTYQIFADDRDGLYAHCLESGVDCKIHYPLPLYRQKGLAHLGYKAGDFPVADRHAETIITLPVHQYLSEPQLAHVVSIVRGFYQR